VTPKNKLAIVLFSTFIDDLVKLVDKANNGCKIGARCTAIFLSRVSILLLTRDIDIAILSVRPSVCPSVCLSVRDTLVLYENGLTYRHSFPTIR